MTKIVFDSADIEQISETIDLAWYAVAAYDVFDSYREGKISQPSFQYRYSDSSSFLSKRLADSQARILHTLKENEDVKEDDKNDR